MYCTLGVTACVLQFLCSSFPQFLAFPFADLNWFVQRNICKNMSPIIFRISESARVPLDGLVVSTMVKMLALCTKGYVMGLNTDQPLTLSKLSFE